MEKEMICFIKLKTTQVATNKTKFSLIMDRESNIVGKF